ncbi:sulfurtransferase TusA family protein [Chloroflexota bacterium]
MPIIVDTRGLSCPMPQQMTMQAIRKAKAGELIVVLSDEAGARDSIIRTSRALQLPYKVEKTAGEYKIHISREELWTEKR